MSKKPLYVIVPIYNAQKYLKECLDSLANQSYKDSTFLLVNDGSTDNSEQIAKEYCTKDSRFILINKQNGGTASARNAGLEYVKNKLESNTHLDSSNEAPLKSPKTSKNVIGGGIYWLCR